MRFDLREFKKNTLGGVFIHLLLALGLFIILGVLYFYVYLPTSTNHGESITVPNVEGLTLAEGDAALARRNLRYEISDSSYSEKHPPLTVLKQYPLAGAKVKEGRKIFVSINRKDPPSVPVPDILNGSLINAEAQLKSNQLKRGKIELVPGSFNVVKQLKFQGQIISPGTRVPKGSAIDLIVEDGGALVAPDVIGEPLEDAKVILYGYDLEIEIFALGDTTDAEVIIMEQRPGPGENIKAGDIVQLWVGPADDTEEQ